MKTITRNTEVAYHAGNEEYKLGIAQCKPNHNNHVLVKFNLGYSRWINVSNLELVN